LQSMKTKHLIYIISIILFFSCGNKNTQKVAPPADIIPAEQMKEIILDVLYVEGAVGVSEQKFHNTKNMTLHYYAYVFKRHNITSEQFLANYNYYAGDIDQMEKIMTEVISDLSEKQGVTKRKSKKNKDEEEE
jgi:hypothetical protein